MVNKFIDEFTTIKKQIENESEQRKTLEVRIQLADKICREIEDAQTKTTEQQSDIINNLIVINKNQSSIKDIVDSFERINERDNEHKMRAIVKMKIQLENQLQEHKQFKKKFDTKITEVQGIITNTKLNKENIETNFKNIISNFSGKISQITDDLQSLKSNQEQMKNPLVE